MAELVHHWLTHEGKPLRRDAVGLTLQSDPGFRTSFADLLREAPFPAYFLELPVCSPAHGANPAELVLVDSPALARVRADHAPFDKVFARHSGQVVTAPNLSGDATLVIPRPPGDWPHLAAFVRAAPAARVDAFFAAVGTACLEWPAERPLWLSTSGLGVYWLHMRLDARPKYYLHAPYRSR